MDPGVSVQNKNFTRNTKKLAKIQRSLQKFLVPDRNPKVIETDNSMEFGKACEDLSWNHCTSTPHRSETNGIAERTVRKVKESTSAVLLQSGLNENWLAENHSITTKNQSRFHQFGKKILPGLFLLRGRNLEGWRTGCRPWRVGDDGRIGNLLKKTQCERGDISQRKKRIFPIADRRIKLPGGDQDLRTSTSIRQRPIQITLIFLENQKGLFHHLMTHFRMPVKQFTIFGPCREASYTAITLNPESNFTRREKNHSLFHWSTLTYPELLIRIWMSSRRSALMNIGTLMGQEICLIHGQASLNLLYWKRKPPDGYMWSGWRSTRKTTYIQARSSMARTLGQNGKECQAEGEAKVVWGKDPSWKRKKIARDLFHRPRG